MHGPGRTSPLPAEYDDAADFLAGERTAEQDEQPDAVGYGPWFEAQYEGECAGCWDQIDPGDRVRADGEGTYLCEDCGDS